MRVLIPAIIAALAQSYCSERDSTNPGATDPIELDSHMTTGGFPQEQWSWVISPQPSDLSTDIGNSPIGIVVRSRFTGQRPSVSMLEELRRQVRILDERGEIVDVETQAVVPEPFDPTGPSDEDGMETFDVVAHVEALPKSQLEKQWYRLQLQSAPEDMRAVGFRNMGAIAVKPPVEIRFAPHSLPTYQTITLCSFPDKPLTVTVVTSQPVLRTAENEQGLGVVVEGDDCAVTPLDRTEVSARLLHIQCDRVKSPTSAFFRIAKPLVGLDGKPVTLLDGRDTFELSWPGDEWVATDAGCVEFAQ